MKDINALGERVRLAREKYEFISMSNTPADEVQRMRNQVALKHAREELINAERELRVACEIEARES